MLADEQIFINSIAPYSEQELKAECLFLYRENRQLKLDRSASERINTETFLQYDQLKTANESLAKENKELKELLEKAINKYALRARSTFGRKTEGLLSLIDSVSNKADEIEDEAQCEENWPENVPACTKIVDFAPRKKDKTNRTDAAPGKKAKQNRLSKSMQDLPKEICYDIDAAALNEKYGAGKKWEMQ